MDKIDGLFKEYISEATHLKDARSFKQFSAINSFRMGLFLKLIKT